MRDYRKEFIDIKQPTLWSEFIRNRCSGITDKEKETSEKLGNFSI